jgi:GntR family transcriptional regulator
MAKHSGAAKLQLVTRSPGQNHSPLRSILEKGLPALYYQLADVFRRRIEEGVWPVDSQIPTLDDLVTQFGAARATVRQALTILEGEGLLARHRGRGTFVLKRPVRDPIFNIGTKRMTLVGPRSAIARKLVSADPEATVPRPSHSGGRLAPSYGRFVRIHSIDGVPYVVRSGYLDSRLWQRLTLQQLGGQPLMRTLINKLGVKLARCEQTITIVAADFEIAKMLEVSLNCPLAVLDRSVFDTSGTLILEARGYYRGDLVKIDATLE